MLCVNIRHWPNYCILRRVRGVGRLGCALAALLLATSLSFSAESPVTATLDRNIVGLGEQVTLTISFVGVQPTSRPTLQIPNLPVVQMGHQTAVSIENSQAVQTTQFIYTLSPTQMGQLTIPSMSFTLGGQTVTTAPLPLTVTKAAPPPRSEVGEVKLLVPKNSIYLGETLPVEIDLYIQAGRNPTSPQLQGDGFTVGTMEQQQPRRARLGNQIYNLVPFKSFVVAAKSGRLALGPASMSLDVPAPNARRDFFGGIADWQRVTLTSEPFELEVKPLPQDNVPATFNGAVGHYTMSVTAGPTNLSVGDPITVRVRLTGTGHLDSLRLPDQPSWTGFQTYPPNSAVNSSDSHHLSGIKDFEQVVVPQDEHVGVLPPVQFSYFDLESGSYRTLTGPAFQLRLRPAEHTARDVPALTNRTDAEQTGPAPEPDDILHIRSQIESGQRKPLLSTPWFLALQGLPALVWIALTITRRRREHFLNNPRLQRQRDVSQRVRKSLAELRNYAKTGAAEQFFATLFRTLQEQLGERLDLPASAITESVIDERLAKMGLAETDRKGLHELFQACNQARYAPHASEARMDELIAQTENVLRQLQALKT